MADTSFHSVNDIPVLTFYEVLKNWDLSLLGEHENPEEVWLNIYDEYCKLSGIDTSNMRRIAKVQGLQKKYDYIVGALEILRHSHYLRMVDGFEEVRTMAYENLSELGYKLDESKKFEDEFKRLITQTESLGMLIKIESEKIEKTDEHQKANIWRELVGLEQITGVKIDPKVDPIVKLIELRNLANEMIKNRKVA